MMVSSVFAVPEFGREPGQPAGQSGAPGAGAAPEAERRGAKVTGGGAVAV